MSEQYSLADLLRAMERPRDPDHGCPWDLAQDFRSIVPSTLEECYELAEAIEHDDFPHVSEELGDVLFQVVFYAQLGSEFELFEGRFDYFIPNLMEFILKCLLYVVVLIGYVVLFVIFIWLGGTVFLGSHGIASFLESVQNSSFGKSRVDSSQTILSCRVTDYGL